MALERAALMRKLRKGVGHMLNRACRLGWHRGEMRSSPRLSRGLMSKAVRHLMHRGLSRGWGKRGSR